VKRGHGDSDDHSMWYTGAIFVHTIHHYPGVSDSLAPFCGPLQQKRKMVLKRNHGAAEIYFKEKDLGGRQQRLGQRPSLVNSQIVISMGFLVAEGIKFDDRAYICIRVSVCLHSSLSLTACYPTLAWRSQLPTGLPGAL